MAWCLIHYRYNFTFMFHVAKQVEISIRIQLYWTASGYHDSNSSKLTINTAFPSLLRRWQHYLLHKVLLICFVFNVSKTAHFKGVSLPRVLASCNTQSILSTKIYMSVEWGILTRYLERISRLQSEDYGQWFNRNFIKPNSHTCGKFILDKPIVPRLVKNLVAPYGTHQLSLSWGR